MAKARKMTPDALMTNVISDREKKGGHAYRTTEHRNHTFGIDIPNLPMQWLLGGINKLPLGRILAFSGEYGSFKSSLAASIGGWFMTQNGIFVDIDTEGKKSPTTYESIYFRMDGEELSRSVMEAAETPEEWQDIANTWLAKVKGEGVNNLPPGDRIPLLINVDSIIGRATEAEQTKMQQEGHASERGYATINNMIKKFMSGISLIGTSCCVSYITHLKDEQADGSGGPMQAKKQKELGGTSPGFYATTIIRTSRGKAIDYVDDEGVTVEGYLVKLKGHKVSTGPNNRVIYVPYLWRYVDDVDHPDGFRQEAWFDWNWACGLMIWRMVFDRDWFKESEYASQLQEVLALKKAGSKTTPKFEQLATLPEGAYPFVDEDGKRLGEMTPREFGAYVHSCPDLMREIQRRVHINLYPDVQEVEHLDYRKRK